VRVRVGLGARGGCTRAGAREAAAGTGPRRAPRRHDFKPKRWQGSSMGLREVYRMRWLLVLVVWWALFVWHPQDEPPAWALFGPFEAKEECFRYLGEHGLPPVFEAVGCVDLEVPGVSR
jgi:hypothetical protein